MLALSAVTPTCESVYSTFGSPDLVFSENLPKYEITVKAQIRLPTDKLIPEEGFIELNRGREVTTLKVANISDRPIQIGSHYHFYESNQGLKFDREKSLGKRLDIPAGTAIRFEPGDQREVHLVPYAGDRKIFGFNGLINDSLNK